MKLVFLGRLEDAAGAAELLIAVAGPLTLAEVMTRLDAPLREALADMRIKVALNGALVARDSAWAAGDGDELAFLPPVSGG